MEFEEYVAARRTALVRSVVLLGCPVADAEDVVQAALERCYRHWRKVQRADRPDAYVYRVLVNVFRDQRSRRWHGELPTETLPDTAVDSDHTAGLAVREALARMDDGPREVLVLRYYADLAEADIAAVLGIAPGTVKSRASRALRELAAETIPVAAGPSSVVRRPPVWPWLLAAAAVVLAAIVVPAALVGGGRETPTAPPTPTTVVVPQTLWMTEDQARSTLADAGLVADTLMEATCEVEAGRVLSTDPTPTRLAEPGTTVLVRVAQTPGTSNCAYDLGLALGLLDLARFGTGTLRFAPEVLVYSHGGVTTLSADEARDPQSWGPDSPLTDLVTWLATPESLIGTGADRGDQYGCGVNDPPSRLTDRASTILSVGPAQAERPGVVIDCHWIRVYRDGQGRVDAVTSTELRPGAENSDSRENQVAEPSTDQRQRAETFARFAATGRGALAFAPEVRLLLGSRLIATVNAEQAADPATWRLPCRSYGEASCPIDALLPLRRSDGAYAVSRTVVRDYDACHQVDAELSSDLIAPDVLARSISLSVPEPQTCAQNWEIQLWYDEADRIYAANFIGGMP